MSGYYESIGPLAPFPDSPGGTTATFGDVDNRVSQQMQVIAVDESAAFVITGKKGGLKGALWLSPDDALALADMLIERYRP